MRLVIDGKLMVTRKAAHEELRRALGFPGWYGRNLDALYDLASTMSGEAVLIDSRVPVRELGEYGEKIIDTLKDAAGDNPNFTFRAE